MDATAYELWDKLRKNVDVNGVGVIYFYSDEDVLAFNQLLNAKFIKIKTRNRREATYSLVGSKADLSGSSNANEASQEYSDSTDRG